MTAIRMGIGTVKSERDKMELLSERKVAETMQVWLGLSPFANKRNLSRNNDFPRFSVRTPFLFAVGTQ